MKNADMPSNPIFDKNGSLIIADKIRHTEASGLTKREHFAGLAMQGMMAKITPNFNLDDIDHRNHAAKICFGMADAMLEEGDKDYE